MGVYIFIHKNMFVFEFDNCHYGEMMCIICYIYMSIPLSLTYSTKGNNIWWILIDKIIWDCHIIYWYIASIDQDLLCQTCRLWLVFRSVVQLNIFVINAHGEWQNLILCKVLLNFIHIFSMQWYMFVYQWYYYYVHVQYTLAIWHWHVIFAILPKFDVKYLTFMFWKYFFQ